MIMLRVCEDTDKGEWNVNEETEMSITTITRDAMRHKEMCIIVMLVILHSSHLLWAGFRV